MNKYTDGLHIKIGNTYIDGGSEPFILRDTNGKEWVTEWHPYCGPTVLRKTDHSPRIHQPNENSRFWKVAVLWKTQGAAVNDGVGVWHEPPVNPLADPPPAG